MGNYILDIDECSTDNGGCGAMKCINSPGTYHCECEVGYYVNPNGGKCTCKNILPWTFLNK